MTPLAVLAGPSRNLAGDVGQDGLDVAAARRVDLLVGAALDGLAQGGLGGQALAQHAVDADGVAVGGRDDLGAGRGVCVVLLLQGSRLLKGLLNGLLNGFLGRELGEKMKLRLRGRLLSRLLSRELSRKMELLLLLPKWRFKLKLK